MYHVEFVIWDLAKGMILVKVHKIFARHSGVKPPDRLSIPLIKQCVRAALRVERVDMPCEINVLITDDKAIRKMNRSFRGIDEPTDVLSFPMREFAPPGWISPGSGASDPETGLLPLGEIVFSGERVHRQAREYGHLLDRETAYLTAHSVLHLLGYDHSDEAADKFRMRGREDAVLREMGFLT